MIVYTVETIGGQITSYEAKKYGFCMWKTPEYILPYRLRNMLYNGQLKIND